MGSGVSLPWGGLSLEKKIQYLRETPYSIYLTPETIGEFAKCFPETIRSAPGKSLALDHSKIYIVCKGEVDLSTAVPKSQNKVQAEGYLCRKRAGDIVSIYNAEETVKRKMSSASHKVQSLAEELTIVGSGDSKILLLVGDMRALDDFCKNHPELSKPIVEIKSSQIEDRLLTIPFLEGIPKAKLSVLAAMCRYEAYDSGQTVFEEDSEADKLFLVLNGVAQVNAKSELSSSRPQTAMSEKSVALQRTLTAGSIPNDDNIGVERFSVVNVTIAELKRGDYFGETALVFNIDRTCSVRTVEKSLFLTVHKTDFENFLKIYPLEASLKEVIKQRMVSKLSTLGIPFLAGVPEEILSSLSSSVEIHDIPKDHVVCRQGDVGDSFFIIVNGGVKVDTVSSGCRSEGSLGPGQYFGEMSLVDSDNNNLRAATVTSTKKSILLSFDKESFQNLLGGNNTILAEINIRLLKQSSKLKHVLAHRLGIESLSEFLNEVHAGENLDFWLAAKSFQEGEGEGDRRAQANDIYGTFCAIDAERQVNIPHTMLGEIDERLESGNDDIPPDLFEASSVEIYRLMEKDCFPRYKKSRNWFSLLERLGVLDL